MTWLLILAFVYAVLFLLVCAFFMGADERRYL